MRGELDYYKTRSGLPAGTLADHKLAYFRAQTATGGSLQDAMTVFFAPQGKGSLLANQLAYYTSQSATSGSLDDVMQAFFLQQVPGA